MIVVAPGSHPQADKFWQEKLHCKPNGARTLGSAMAKNIADLFEPYYDMVIAYASDIPYDIPEGVKKIAIMWHQNYPWTDGFKVWQRVNVRLQGYEVDYFVNEQKLIDLIKEFCPNVYYLPRFIDTSEYPKFDVKKDIDTLWFGNAWGEFKGEFDMYKHVVPNPMWITHGELGRGNKKVMELPDRKTTLEMVARSKTVWAIGISQLEAQFYGAKIVSYRGPVLPYYNEKTIRSYLRRLLQQKTLGQK